MSRGIWEAVETETEKIRMAKMKGRRGKVLWDALDTNNFYFILFYFSDFILILFYFYFYFYFSFGQ